MIAWPLLGCVKNAFSCYSCYLLICKKPKIIAVFFAFTFFRTYHGRSSIPVGPIEHLRHLEDRAAPHQQGALPVPARAHAHHHLRSAHHAVRTTTQLLRWIFGLGNVLRGQCQGHAEQTLRQRHQRTLRTAVLGEIWVALAVCREHLAGNKRNMPRKLQKIRWDLNRKYSPSSDTWNHWEPLINPA